MPDRGVLVRAARLIGNDARAAMLLLLDREGEASSSDLAVVADLSTSAATYHLATMVGAGLVTSSRRGRLVIHRLASPSVSAALEALALIGSPEEREHLGVADPPDRMARTCYRHLGGRVAVGIMDSMRRRRWILEGADGPRLTIPAIRELRALGVDLRRARGDVRPILRPCMDRTERRPHIGGRLGIGLANWMFRERWIERTPGSRAVAITPEGCVGLAEVFELPNQGPW